MTTNEELASPRELQLRPPQDRVRGLFQQPDQATSNRYRVEGAVPPAQVQRWRRHELFPTFPLQRNGAALCHLQRPVAQEGPASAKRATAAPKMRCSRCRESARRRGNEAEHTRYMAIGKADAAVAAGNGSGAESACRADEAKCSEAGEREQVEKPLSRPHRGQEKEPARPLPAPRRQFATFVQKKTEQIRQEIQLPGRGVLG